MLDRRIADGLLNTREAAALLHVRPRTMEYWRSQNTGPTYSRIGHAIRYSRAALNKFISDNQQGPSPTYPDPIPKLPGGWQSAFLKV
jgi:hypothetical protein